MRAIFFQENDTSYRSVHTTVKRSCLVVPTYHNKKFGKSRVSEGEILKLLRQDLQGAIFTKENRKITNDTPFESERIIAVEDIFSIGMMVDQHPPTYG